jgi:hypothetical protein
MTMADDDKETVVVTESRGGGGTVAVVIAVLALLVVLFLLFGRDMLSGDGTTDIKADVDISAPEGSSGGTGSDSQ